jgi:hypothetical protein
MSLFRAFEKRPDHPLGNSGDAQRVLDAIEASEPLAAIEEVQHWLQSLSEFEGFACDSRLSLVKRLDEVSRPLLKDQYGAFYARAHGRDRAQRKLGALLEQCWRDLAAAYARCIADNERGEKRASEIRGELPLALARCYRASFMAAKARCMMYLPVSPPDWLALYKLLAFAELAHFDTAVLQPYPGEVRSTPRTELTKLFAFALATPHELPPEQVELCARIVDRFAASFVWSSEHTEQCRAVIDLARGGPPHHARSRTQSAGRRYFGAGPALPKLAELEGLSGQDLLSEELRFGGEFTPTQVITVIRHLRRHLSEEPPPQPEAQVAVSAAFRVIRGFRAICQRVTAIDVGTNAALQEDLKVAAAEKAKQGLEIEAEEIEAEPETWRMVNRSDWGLGVQVPTGLGTWIEPGVLCGIQEHDKGPWSVAIIRRLDLSIAGAASAGIQLLSKKPVSVWLRVLGREGQEASNWATATGSFAFDYARAIVLSDAPRVNDRPVLLLEGHKFVPDQLCEVVMGEHSRHIKLVEFLEEGADYVRAGFAWMAPGKS